MKVGFSAEIFSELMVPTACGQLAKTTVNLRISARGAHFKFRRRHDHFSDTLSAHKHQHKLFDGMKS